MAINTDYSYRFQRYDAAASSPVSTQGVQTDEQGQPVGEITCKKPSHRGGHRPHHPPRSPYQAELEALGLQPQGSAEADYAAIQTKKQELATAQQNKQNTANNTSLLGGNVNLNALLQASPTQQLNFLA